MATTLAIAGDSIINRRVSGIERPAVQSYLDVLRKADLGITHLEGLIHDFDRDDIYPDAVAGGHWLRGPGFVAEELREMGVGMVSHASNHAMDYGAGGLFATLDALDEAGVTHAGTGENLAAADAPAYRETGEALVGLVSMSTSFSLAHRAGEARRDVLGRPGVNPLGVEYAVDEAMRERIVEQAEMKGWWVTQRGDRWLLNPPGVRRAAPDVYVESDDPAVEEAGGLRPVLNQRDRERNLAAVSDAAGQADIVVAHVHYHSWDRAAGTDVPGPHMPPFARSLVDAGADVVFFQGTHTPIRGIELYDSRPIIYDPGDFLFMTDSINRIPKEYYDRYGDRMDVHVAEARPSDAHVARGDVIELGESEPEGGEEYYGGRIHNPSGGYFAADVLGNIVPVVEFDEEFEPNGVTVYPGRLQAEPKLLEGVSQRVHGAHAEEIVKHLDALSRRYDTRVRRDGDLGRVELA